MDIKLDEKHHLVSDNNCYWIEAMVEPEGKKAYRKRVSGYTATFEQVVESYINAHIRSSEATKIARLAKEIKALKEEVRGWHETNNGKLKG